MKGKSCLVGHHIDLCLSCLQTLMGLNNSGETWKELRSWTQRSDRRDERTNENEWIIKWGGAKAKWWLIWQDVDAWTVWGCVVSLTETLKPPQETGPRTGWQFVSVYLALIVIGFGPLHPILSYLNRTDWVMFHLFYNCDFSVEMKWEQERWVTARFRMGAFFSTPLPSRRHASFDFNVFSVPHGPDLGEKHMKDFGAWMITSRPGQRVIVL